MDILKRVYGREVDDEPAAHLAAIVGRVEQVSRSALLVWEQIRWIGALPQRYLDPAYHDKQPIEYDDTPFQPGEEIAPGVIMEAPLPLPGTEEPRFSRDSDRSLV